MTIAPDFELHPALARLWVVGCGAMGGALLDRWLAAGLEANSVTVIDPAPSGLPEGFAGQVASDVASAASTCAERPSTIVLGIKPQALGALAPQLVDIIQRSEPLILSMLAGVQTVSLAKSLSASRIVRIMPNLPARIGRGAAAMFARGANAGDKAAMDWLLGTTGSAVWLDDEKDFDAVTGLSGSGPAYVFRFIEALADAGESAGLDPETAARLALETVAGAADMAAKSGVGPAELRRQVTSPNGTTQAGLAVLDGDGALSRLLRATVRAAAERSRALASAADTDQPMIPEAGRVGS